METISAFEMLVVGLIPLALIAILIFLIIRRIRIRKNETFEKRDN
ncbi:MAG: hypothetical protein PHT69_07975 [Bacteroidales bacterium]|nr:hypothetical protein [Bacteroidales bacterium]